MPMLPGLVIHKMADKSGPEPDLEAGESWPLAGIRLLDAPEVCTVSTSYVEQARNEGWVTLEGESVVVRPAGPADDQFKSVHVFHQCDAIVFHTVDGDVRYLVTHQPDKYACAEDATYPDQVPAKTKTDNKTSVTTELYAAGATRVDNFYGITKEA